ncbi:UNVERIFIED_CONTAM: hypothetical protein FKN15_046159 [Acipenser sinensis]
MIRKWESGTKDMSLEQMPREGKLERDGTVYLEHLRYPKNAIKHIVSMRRSSKGLKQPFRKIDMRERISEEMGSRVREVGAELLDMLQSVRRTAGMARRIGEDTNMRRLEENYEIAEGVCIPRSALYMHYLDFCEKNDTQPVNAASFGKIIRQQFPQLTTRRLGTRGQSKYHYYGIAVKESSQYYDVMYSKKGAAWVNETGKKEVTKQTVAYSPRSKLGTLLPEFPNVKDLNLPASLPEEKVQSFLLHFWQGMPPHMLPVLGSSTVVSIVGVCDSILYKTISGVLMPTVLQALPDSLTQVIRKFAKQLDEWLKVALHDLPENLRNIKFELYQEFDHLLEEQSPIESYIEWLDSMVDSCVVKVAGKIPGSLKKVAQQFLLMWSCFGTRVIRDMTLHSAPSFGSFHLIHLMFDDYVLYVLESLHCQERANKLMRAMKAEGSTGEKNM